MGVFQSIINNSEIELPNSIEPLHFDNRRILVFTKSNLSLIGCRIIISSFKHATIFTPFHNESGVPCISYGVYRGEPVANAAVLKALEDGADTAVFLWTLPESSGRLLMKLARSGIKRFSFLSGNGWSTYSSTKIFWATLGTAIIGAIIRPARVEHPPKALPSDDVVSPIFDHLLKRKVPMPEQGKKLRLIHYVSSLYCGGAERQVCFLATALKQMGHAICVYTCGSLEGDSGHYSKSLTENGISHGQAGEDHKHDFLIALASGQVDPMLFKQLPVSIKGLVCELLGESVTFKPDIIHASLDHPNVVAGAVGLMTDVPAIILSTRNVNPTNFPRFYHSSMKTWYKFLAKSPRVHFIANSHNGAKDYAKWLDIPVERFHVILNGVDVSQIKRPLKSETEAFRASIGIAPNDLLLIGVFRIDPEKQPLVFVQVVEKVVRAIPGLKVAIAGIGILEKEMKDAVDKAGLTSNFIFLGRRNDVPVIMGAANILLLTSCVEGTPNVLLEAQYIGCPVVATKAGGTPDAVNHGQTGYLHEVDDVQGLADSVIRLLRDPELCERFKKAGPKNIEEKFGLERMVNETVDLYHHALGWKKA